MKKLLAILAMVSIFSGAQAADNTSEANLGDLSSGMTASNDNPQGWVPFLGFGLSAVEFDSDLTGRDGVAGNAKILGSNYMTSIPWILDLGAGLHTADLNNNSTNSALIETAFRYRFGKRKKWHFGPVADFLLGNDIGVDYGSSEADLATFAGAQLFRDFAIGDRGILRAGLKATTDIGIPDSFVHNFLFELHVGFAPEGTKIEETHTVETESQVLEETLDDLNNEEELAKEELKEEILVSKYVITSEASTRSELIRQAYPKSVFFNVNEKKAQGENEKTVSEIAAFIKANMNYIREVNIIGYADPTGPSDHNLWLSKERANFVSDAIASTGFSNVKTKNTAAGELSGTALSNARRVDVEIVGKKGAAWLAEINGL